MVVKFKRKRRLFIKIFSVLVSIFFIAAMISAIQNENNTLTFISFIFQLSFWFGMLYFQAARYDDKKISAQFGWPRIYYEDIVSIKSKWGDIIIKSEKREISINRDTVDEESLKKFINHLDQKTSKPLNKKVLL